MRPSRKFRVNKERDGRFVTSNFLAGDISDPDVISFYRSVILSSFIVYSTEVLFPALLFFRFTVTSSLPTCFKYLSYTFTTHWSDCVKVNEVWFDLGSQTKQRRADSQQDWRKWRGGWRLVRPAGCYDVRCTAAFLQSPASYHCNAPPWCTTVMPTSRLVDRQTSA